jgi:hypothetical protein
MSLKSSLTTDTLRTRRWHRDKKIRKERLMTLFRENGNEKWEMIYEK